MVEARFLSTIYPLFIAEASSNALQVRLAAPTCIRGSRKRPNSDAHAAEREEDGDLGGVQRRRRAVRTICREPKLEDLLSDPILDVLLERDRVSREELTRVVEQARRTLARVPREWWLTSEPVMAGEHSCPRSPDRCATI